jgi:hypothetical protein
VKKQSEMSAVLNELQSAIELAEAKIAENHCPFPVDCELKEFVIGWQRCKCNGKTPFKICILFEGKSEEENEWRPLESCSVVDRLAALPHVSRLNDAVRERASVALTEIASAITEFKTGFGLV